MDQFVDYFADLFVNQYVDQFVDKLIDQFARHCQLQPRQHIYASKKTDDIARTRDHGSHRQDGLLVLALMLAVVLLLALMIEALSLEDSQAQGH